MFFKDWTKHEDSREPHSADTTQVGAHQPQFLSQLDALAGQACATPPEERILTA